MPTKIQIKRGTRAQLETAKSAAGLRAGELYHITDEARIAIGSGTSSYIALVKESEGGFAGVAAPTNLLPKPGAIGLTNVRLVGSIYYSTEGKAHAATKVQISSSATFGTLAFEATKGAVTGVRISAADIASDASYYWRMAYQDMSGAWSAWSVPTAFAVGALQSPVVSGGTATTDGIYTIRTFTGSGTLTVANNEVDCEVLVVAGGGGGGASGGGGGGGGVRYWASIAVGEGTHAVTVGAGGLGAPAADASSGSTGGDSALATIGTAKGGGGGGGYGLSGGAGGCGGGGGDGATTGGAATLPAQGYAGGGGNTGSRFGGGGGAGAIGDNATALPLRSGNGGAGFACAISPAATHYAGGGGGGYVTTGGIGGGGPGTEGAGVAASANTGGGGGGSGSRFGWALGGAGGSGIVIVRYLTT